VNKYKICLLLVMLFITSSLFALDGVFLSLGGEANGNTREGVAAGGVLTIGADINRYFSLGFKKGYSLDFKNIKTIEDVGFFRFYPLESFARETSLQNPLFVQAELGTITFFEDGKSSPSVSAGLAAGCRFIFGKNFYLEPVVRGGYPFI